MGESELGTRNRRLGQQVLKVFGEERRERRRETERDRRRERERMTDRERKRRGGGDD